MRLQYVYDVAHNVGSLPWNNQKSDDFFLGLTTAVVSTKWDSVRVPLPGAIPMYSQPLLPSIGGQGLKSLSVFPRLFGSGIASDGTIRSGRQCSTAMATWLHAKTLSKKEGESLFV